MYNIHSTLAADNAYQQGDKSVLIKGHSKGAITVVTAEDLEHLHANAVFNLHKKNGFIKVVSVEDAAKENESEAGDAGEGTTLLGSSVQPATFTLKDDTVLQLADVVQKAFDESGKSEKQWNALKDTTRDKLIQAVVDDLPLKEEA